MALIKLSTLVTQASGKIAGVVFSRNRYGPYVRANAVPVNPNTDRQSVARTRLSALAARWNEVLTQAQRDAWDLYAANVTVTNKLGDQVYITGFNHYIRSNTAILACGGTIVDAAPQLYSLPETDPTFAVALSEGTQLITVTFDDTMDVYDEDGGYLSVQMGLPKVNNVNFFNGPWRFADSVDGDSTTPPTTDATIAVPWPVTEDQKVWCQARIIRADGRVSNFFRDSASVGS